MTIIVSDPSRVHPERWALIGSGHEVSCRGRVRREGRLKAPWPSSRGYLYVDIKGSKRRVHRLVVEAFVGPIPEGFVVDHVNGCKTDNRLENLEVITHQQNMDRAKAAGVFKGGAGRRGTPRVSDQERDQIRSDRSSGMSVAQLCEKYGRARSLIQKVCAA